MEDLIKRLQLIRKDIESGKLGANGVRDAIMYSNLISDTYMDDDTIFMVALILCNKSDSDYIANIESMLTEDRTLNLLKNNIGVRIRKLNEMMRDFGDIGKLLLSNPKHVQFNSWDRPGDKIKVSKYKRYDIRFVDGSEIQLKFVDGMTQFVHSDGERIDDLFHMINHMDVDKVKEISSISSI